MLPDFALVGLRSVVRPSPWNLRKITILGLVMVVVMIIAVLLVLSFDSSPVVSRTRGRK